MSDERMRADEKGREHRLVLIGLVGLMVVIGIMITATVIIAGGISE